MERRVLIAITLSFLVLFLFQRFVLPPPPAPAPAGTAAQAGASQGAPPAASGATGVAATPSAPAAPGAQPSGGASSPQALKPSSPATSDLVIGEQSEREIVVETATVRAVFTNKGARLLHWTLKGYQTDTGAPVELVPQKAGVDAVKPFSLAVDDPAVTALLNTALYRVSGAPGTGPGAGGTVTGSVEPSGSTATIDATSKAATISFDMATAAGLSAKKTFTFEPTGYIVSFGSVVEQAGQRLNPAIEWGPGLGDDIALAKPASFFAPSYNTPAQAIIHKDGKVERIAKGTAASQDGSFQYAGVDDHYFVAMALNQETPVPLHVEYSPIVVPQLDVAGMSGHYVRYAVRYATPQDTARFFVGPKAFDDLRTLNTEMVRVINFGMFSWLAVPLLGALKWVYGYVGNWGWAIVVLTVLINLAMFPLRHKSVVSMRKMQELQPQLKAIQDRYAKFKVTDPERQKMNTEVMDLYKSKGVNPASGCVPMLLTLPFLFAFYAMLGQAIEIRGAHFFGWIHNLSAPDPLFIMPILMGISMFWQQKMTPSTMDPAQQKIMMFMPVMFTFMSLSFPSGLVIYWFVSNMWAIGQQQVTNYLIGAAKPATK